MLTYMSYLAFGSLLLAVIALVFIRKKIGRNAFIKAIFAGLFSAAFYTIVEYLGTSTANWTYYKSIYLTIGLMPIEFTITFFAAGVVAYTFHLWEHNDKFNLLNINYWLYLMAIFTTYIYLRGIAIQDPSMNLLIVLIPLGLWGIINIKRQNLESVFIIASFAAIADIILEFIFMLYGEYTYLAGFTWNIPMDYFISTFFLFGVMEKLDLLDKVLDSRILHLLLKKTIYKRREKVKEFFERLK